MADAGTGEIVLAHAPETPSLLRELDVTIALTTYQAGKLVFLSAPNDEQVIQLPRTFSRAMALGVNGRQLAIATRDTVEIFAHDERLAPGYPRRPETYDTLYAPRVTYHTGRIDCHGIEWGDDGIWIVNTLFSCLATLSADYSFTPQWQPSFVSELAPEDRCHLNGMAMEGGRPRFVTCLGTGDSGKVWKSTIPTGGVVLDVDSGEAVASDLPMPHSPRLIGNELFLLFSGTGELVALDPASGRYEVIQRLDRFVRGLAFYDDYLFVAASRIRPDSSSFGKLDIADSSDRCGVFIYHLPSGAMAGGFVYHSGVDEIFDVAVLPGLRRPGIVDMSDEERGTAVSTHGFTEWSKDDRATSG